MKIIVGLFFSLFVSFSYSQSFVQLNAAQILHQIQKLNTVGSVLYIAAHPDDENTRLISYLTNELNLRTGYLALTRGDGGQNLIGTEQGDALGLLRTQELLAARRVDGAEQFFTRANDFGYSKNPEETLNIWNRDSVLADMVWVIRKFQPDVIICRFPTTGEGGHGHHTTSAILAEEAFEAASDSNRFKSQLKYVSVWKTKQLFWNTFQFGSVNTTSPDQLKLDVGGYNSLLGKSYGEIAAASRTMHKSQGFGVPMQRGEEIEYFKWIKGEFSPHDSIFEKMDFSWNRFAITRNLQRAIKQIINKYDLQHPEKSIHGLIAVYRKLNEINTTDNNLINWIAYQKKNCQNILLQCAGIWMEASAEDYRVVPGEELPIKIQIILRNSVDVTLERICFPDKSEQTSSMQVKRQLPLNRLETYRDTIRVDANRYSDPYWLKRNHPVSTYKVDNQQLIGRSENTPALLVTFDLIIEGEKISCKKPIVFKANDPVKGEVYRPLEILPPVTINSSEEVIVFGDSLSKQIEFKIIANKDQVDGRLRVDVPNGWRLEIQKEDFQLSKKGDEIVLNGTIYPSEKSETVYLKSSVEIGEKLYDKAIERIEYDHIPYQFFLKESATKLVRLDLKRNKQRIAYIPGAGDKVAECIAQMGYQVTILNETEIEQTDLSHFDAIVTGIRAFNVHPKLIDVHERLMKYIQDGGNFIVQYNTNNRIAPLTAFIGPYPFQITTQRVTDEEATVRFVHPGAKVLNLPNVITEKDFEDWIQERGLYFADSIDNRYEKVFAMHDKSEAPLEGSTIIGKYGKGNFVYTGLSFFRELPAGVKGAYRLFANLLEL